MGPENMGSCRMGGGGGPMGPGVSMGPMSASEAQTLPSNVISKQAGSMEVTLTHIYYLYLLNILFINKNINVAPSQDQVTLLLKKHMYLITVYLKLRNNIPKYFFLSLSFVLSCPE